MNEFVKLDNNLDRIHEVKKMSQGDVMCSMGCNRSYLSNIENKKHIHPLIQCTG